MAAQHQPSAVDSEAFLLRPEDVAFRKDTATQSVRIRHKGRDVPVSSMAMAFPLSRRGRMIVVRDHEGREIGILTGLSGIDPASRRVVLDELERAYFLPRITNIQDITEEHGILEWQVETDRGARTFQLRHIRQSLRRFGKWRVVILDVDGNRYEIPDWTALPRRAQSLLDPYV